MKSNSLSVKTDTPCARTRCAAAMKQSFISRWKWLCLGFPGFISLIWFLVRVVPKPSRAAYPCQRAAAPMAASFLVALFGLAGSAVAFRNARHFLRKSRYILAMLCIFVGLATAVLMLVGVPDTKANLWEPADGPNSPVGTARGLYPGRVTWVHDPAATSWTGSTSSYWWASTNTDQAVVDSMTSKSVRWLAGKPNDAEAWDALFKHFNRSHGRGDVGYQSGEKVAIKVNMANSTGTTWRVVQNVSPQVIKPNLRS